MTGMPTPPGGRRLRIAVLNRVFSPTGGGAERYSIALVEQLAARHEIHVFAQQLDHDWPGVTYHKVIEPFVRPRWINQVWYAVTTWWATRRGFDIVHSHETTWHGNVQTVHVMPVKYNLFHGRSGGSLLLRCLTTLLSPRLLGYLAMERLRFATQPNRCVVVTSSTLKEVMSQSYPGCVVSVIPPGAALPPEPVERAAARHALQLPSSGQLLAFVANDYQKKGLSTLLQAMSHLPSDVMLAVVGNPTHVERFQKQVKALGLSARVFFLGYLRDVSLLYAAVDVLAHPTTEDTFAMVVLEAMAHGLPVVVSGPSYCGIASLLNNQVDAMILASPTDEHELASVLERILKDHGLRERLSAGARHFAVQRSWTGAALQQELIYREIVDRRHEQLELPSQPMKLTPQAIPALTQFSIVIPSWNNLAFLRLCVDSVCSNSTFSHQIIVHVNDGSDGTLEWVQARGLAHTHSAGNIGICLAVNQCAALAQHDLILYLNDDMYCCPQWDSKLLEKVQQIGHDAFMLSGTMIEPVDSRNPCVSVSDFGGDVETFRQSEILQRFHTQAKINWYGATWPPTLVHKRWWHAVGGYSTEFSPGMASDSDFSMKMWAAGCRVFFGIGDSLVYHFMCKSTGRIVKNNGRKQFMRKWGMTSSFFDHYYLRRGQTVTDMVLTEPAMTSQFRRKLAFNKLKASLAR